MFEGKPVLTQGGGSRPDLAWVPAGRGGQEAGAEGGAAQRTERLGVLKPPASPCTLTPVDGTSAGFASHFPRELRLTTCIPGGEVCYFFLDLFVVGGGFHDMTVLEYASL